MKCMRCQNKAVIKLQQGPLCKHCFMALFEKKVYGTIRKFRLLEKSDAICVACSGGKDSTTALHLMVELAKTRNQEIFALAIDEGIAGYREHTLSDLRNYCAGKDIKLKVASFKNEFGMTLDEMVKKAAGKNISSSKCAMCGIFRRRLLNIKPREFGADVVVTGHNLDDEAQTILMNMFRGGPELAARLGPKTGTVQYEKFVKRVKPLYFCTEKEVRLYSLLKGFNTSFHECHYSDNSYRTYIRKMLNSIESSHSGSKTGMVSNFIKMLPLLKSEFAGADSGECGRCGEPGMKNPCAACRLIEELV